EKRGCPASEGEGGLTPPFNYLFCEFFQPVDIAVKPRHGNPSCVACSFRVYQVHCVDNSVFGVFLLLQVEEIPHEDTTVVTFSVYLNPSAFSFPNFVLFPYILQEFLKFYGIHQDYFIDDEIVSMDSIMVILTIVVYVANTREVEKKIGFFFGRPSEFRFLRIPNRENLHVNLSFLFWR